MPCVTRRICCDSMHAERENYIQDSPHLSNYSVVKAGNARRYQFIEDQKQSTTGVFSVKTNFIILQQ